MFEQKSTCCYPKSRFRLKAERMQSHRWQRVEGIPGPVGEQNRGLEWTKGKILRAKIFKWVRGELALVRQWISECDPTMPASQMSSSLSPNCSTSASTPIMCLGRQWKIVQVLGLLTACGRPGVPGSLLWLGPAPAIVAMWDMNQYMEDLLLYAFLSLSVTLTFKQQTSKQTKKTF